MRCSYLKGIWEDSKILQKEKKVLSKDLGVIMLLVVSKVSLEARRWWRMPSNVRENTLSAQNSIASPWKMRPISIKWGAESRHLQTCKGATNRPPRHTLGRSEGWAPQKWEKTQKEVAWDVGDRNHCRELGGRMRGAQDEGGAVNLRGQRGPMARTHGREYREGFCRIG